MGLLDRLFGRFQNQQTAVVDPQTLSPYQTVGGSPFDLPTPARVQSQLGAFYGVTTLEVSTFAMLPWQSVRAGTQQPLDPTQTPAVVRRPDPTMTPRQFRAELAVAMVYDSEAWLVPTARDPRTDQVMAVRVAFNGEVRTAWDERAGRRRVPIYYLNDQEVQIDRDLFHLYDWRLHGEINGFGPSKAGRRVVNSGLAADEYATRLFREDATPPGYFKMPGSGDQKEANRILKQWVKGHAEAQRGPGVMFGGAEYVTTAFRPDQLQAIESRTKTVGDVARLFNMPGELLGWSHDGSSLTYTNLPSLYQAAVRQAFQPHLIAPVEDLWSTHFMPPGQEMRVDFSELVRADRSSRAATHKTEIESGTLTIDEARAEEARPPLGVTVPPERDEGLTLSLSDLLAADISIKLPTHQEHNA